MTTILNSESTGVACVNTNRKVVSRIELDKEYFEIAEERISNIFKEG